MLTADGQTINTMAIGFNPEKVEYFDYLAQFKPPEDFGDRNDQVITPDIIDKFTDACSITNTYTEERSDSVALVPLEMDDSWKSWLVQNQPTTSVNGEVLEKAKQALAAIDQQMFGLMFDIERRVVMGPLEGETMIPYSAWDLEGNLVESRLGKIAPMQSGTAVCAGESGSPICAATEDSILLYNGMPLLAGAVSGPILPGLSCSNNDIYGNRFRISPLPYDCGLE